MLRGVIFDFDGVLVDSEKAHFQALRRVLSHEVGIHITVAEYAQHYLGYDDPLCFRRAFELHDLHVSPVPIADLVHRKGQVYREGLADVSLSPGARSLVEALHQAQVPLAIASGSRRREIEVLLRAQDLLGRFRGIVSAEDVSNFKPHPEPYLRGLQVIGAMDSPEDVVAFEDSRPGMASARAARLRVIGVCSSQPREAFPLAHFVVGSLTQITVAEVGAVARGEIGD